MTTTDADTIARAHELVRRLIGGMPHADWLVVRDAGATIRQRVQRDGGAQLTQLDALIVRLAERVEMWAGPAPINVDNGDPRGDPQ